MNPVFHAASDANEMGVFMGLTTLSFLAFFLFWVWWAWRPANAALMEAAARMPLDDTPDGRS